MIDTNQPGDPHRIDIYQDSEVRYWTSKWKVSPERLRAAVKKVGVVIADVIRELERAQHREIPPQQKTRKQKMEHPQPVSLAERPARLQGKAGDSKSN